MILKEKERTVIQDLQTQEKSCVEKYGRYAEQAKDPELKNLFQTIQKEEQKHYDSLTQVLDGQVPQCDCNDSDGKDYEPKQTYKMMDDSEDKKNDEFLATDCIGTEKLVSGEYNGEIFAFGESAVRSRSRIMRRCSTSIRSQMEWCREKLTQGSINCKEDMYHRWYISSFLLQ